jgi:GT2 family glycosyltransferase
MSAPLLVSIVTHNDADLLDKCLESLEKQTVALQVRIFDNASVDGTVAVARRRGMSPFCSPENRGFCHGHNQNLLPQDFEAALVLNADVILQPDFLERLTEAVQAVPGAGMAGGKLYRMDAQGRTAYRNGFPILDSTGMYVTPSQRHFDRGSEQEDRGQFDRRQLLFGITGAALFCTREMLEDLRDGDEYFDEDFFAYREDADLAWRAQLRGWKAVYEPFAVGLHLRKVLPDRRASVSPLVNRHSLKNRYLLRIKNMDPAVRRRCLPYMWIRDLSILIYVLLFEWSSLPAYAEVWRLRDRLSSKRRIIQSRRKVPDKAVAEWFSFQPVARDLPIAD